MLFLLCKTSKESYIWNWLYLNNERKNNKVALTRTNCEQNGKTNSTGWHVPHFTPSVKQQDFSNGLIITEVPTNFS